ncbi:MAG: endonuclease/exonuclease/phosphatase family protein [Phototrophicaceae bacterium]
MKRRPPSPFLMMPRMVNRAIIAYVILRVLFGSRWWWLGFLNTFAFWLFLPLIAVALLAAWLGGKRSASVSLLLFVLGMLQFAPLPIGLFTASDAPHDIRVLTYNVLGHNGRIIETVDWMIAQDADILILQELIDDNLDSQLPRLLALYPHHTYVDGNVRILSRLPMLDGETIWLQDPSPTRDGRLAVRAVVDLDGQALTIYGVHLNVPRGTKHHGNIVTGIDTLDFILRYDESNRNAQIYNLVERIRNEQHPVILAGDFNTSHTSPILGNLSAIGMVDAFRAVGTGWGMTWSHQPPALPLIRIDYVWASSDFIARRFHLGGFMGADGSDHLPLVVDYSLNSQ